MPIAAILEKYVSNFLTTYCHKSGVQDMQNGPTHELKLYIVDFFKSSSR